MNASTQEALKAALAVLEDYARSNPKQFYRGAWIDPRGVHGACDKARAALAQPQAETPIDMVLYCPSCHLQHIDAPELPESRTCKPDGSPVIVYSDEWNNPPHRSHLCHGCGHVWRPADVPTNGVQAVTTKGKNDSPPQAETAAVSEPAKTLPRKELERFNLDVHYDGFDQMREFVLASEHDDLVHLLETNCDPSGTVRELAQAKDVIRELEASNRMLRDRLSAPAAPDAALVAEVLREFDRKLKEAWSKEDNPYATAYGWVRQEWQAALASQPPTPPGEQHA